MASSSSWKCLCYLSFVVFSGLASMSFRTLIRWLAYLGVISIFVHIFAFCMAYGFSQMESGLGEAEEALDNQTMASAAKEPQWFPDGSQIVFSHKGSIFLIDASGSHLQVVHGSGKEPVAYNVIDLAYAPSVAPDGSRIAYSAYTESGWFLWKSESWEIITSKPDGSDKRQLTKNENLDVGPAWSPEGGHIAFMSAPLTNTYRTRGIYVMTADGSASRSIVMFADLGGSIGSVQYENTRSPVWSQSGENFAFVLKQVEESSRVLFVTTADGSSLKELAEEASPPTWSPQGSRIAFAMREAWHDDYPQATAAGIYIIRVDGSDLQKIVAFPSREVPWSNSISWSPDGSEILFGAYVINIDGSDIRRLPGPGSHTAWSPDGSRIAVYAGSDSDVVLYTVARDGSDGRILVERNDEGSLVASNGRPFTLQ